MRENIPLTSLTSNQSGGSCKGSRTFMCQWPNLFVCESRRRLF